MSYPTVQFDKVYKEVLRATGRPETLIALLTAAQQENIAELINEQLAEFFEEGFWPGTYETEQRTIDATDKYILKAASGETVIGRIEPEECFFADEPQPGSLKDVLGLVEDRGDRIVCFDEDCPAQPWIRFQIPPPQFTRSVYSDATTYALAQLTYDETTGECYKSLQAANLDHAVTETAWWEKVNFPALAETYIKWSASSEWMSIDDGKYQQMERANRVLDRLVDKHLPRLQVGR